MLSSVKHFSIKQQAGRRDGEKRDKEREKEKERKSKEMEQDRQRAKKKETEVETVRAYGTCLQ